MFADDVGLLPAQMFTRMLQQARRTPAAFLALAGELFRVMATGGRVGFEAVDWFNGGLFDDDAALPLEQSEIRDGAGGVRPRLVGDRSVDPWHAVRARARSREARTTRRALHRPRQDHADRRAGGDAPVAGQVGRGEGRDRRPPWTDRKPPSRPARGPDSARPPKGSYEPSSTGWRAFTVLDPACGSGNFLYLALHALKDLEHRVQLEAEALGFQRAFPDIGPANVKGIEINPYAAELARVSVWIGEIQWMRRNGFAEARNPILKPLDTIECRDAILTPDSAEPEWPEADVVIGNPPFLGDRVMRGGLGHERTERLRRTYQGSVPASADLVCFWFHRAGELVNQGKITRAGLVATNSIRGGNNRAVLDRIVEHGAIFDAWSDEPWVVDGAAVRVSLIYFARRSTGLAVFLNGTETAHIHADLSEGGIDLTRASKLARTSPPHSWGQTRTVPSTFLGTLRGNGCGFLPTRMVARMLTF